MEYSTQEQITSKENRISQLIEKIESQIANIAGIDDSLLLDIVTTNPSLAAQTMYEQACVINEMKELRTLDEQLHDEIAEEKQKAHNKEISELYSRKADDYMRAFEYENRCKSLLQAIKTLATFIPSDNNN